MNTNELNEKLVGIETSLLNLSDIQQVQLEQTEALIQSMERFVKIVPAVKENIYHIDELEAKEDSIRSEIKKLKEEINSMRTRTTFKGVLIIILVVGIITGYIYQEMGTVTKQTDITNQKLSQLEMKYKLILLKMRNLISKTHKDQK